MNNKFVSKQQKLFDRAAALFAEKGYHGTSISDLARAMELQKGSLYHYFKSKEELLFQLLDDYISGALREIEAICRAESEPVARLQRFMLFYTGFYAGNRDRLILLINDIDKLGPELRARVLSRERLYYQVLTDIFQELQAAGLMKALPLPVAAFAFFGMVHYTYKWYRADGKISPESLSAMFFEIFTRGVFAGKAEEESPERPASS
ncbi:MAG: TetR family transcriptional regulator [Deltaproteobacteria bacterium]|nr:TetR family transcriptional regulator [Deltaproteobacteria bacterium]